ncbi:uncharacterized protein LOC128670340 [Plodia interpunctella]|uniref:uncharacterized protein LOC128670340 n=1 Tax=Plodia interpunctella TaxID=58824 RepID=UPI0023677735|nr:uncharacterized protein LOC128670340 [Plodia interpunctella]
MPFERVWDETCPRIWDQWQADGTRYTIQDLPPEDDEEAVKVLLENLATDEVLCKLQGLVDDPASMRGMAALWRNSVALRMSLACYAERDGARQLVAVNVCLVKEKGVEPQYDFEGEKYKNVLDAVVHSEKKANPLEYLGLDKALAALGLTVVREYRGAKLGSRILSAREPLCRALGIGGTTTIFTGIAAQKSAARSGFHSIYENPIKEYADVGLDYPKDDERVVKIMVKKYV